MYGALSDQDQNLRQIMANIQIPEIREQNKKGEERNSRMGQLIRNDLLEFMTPKGSSGQVDYILNVQYRIERKGYGIRADESVTLQNLKLLVTYELREIKIDKIILRAQARGIVTYDLVQSDYSNMIARKSALERLSKEATHQISIKIGTFLHSSQNKDKEDKK